MNYIQMTSRVSIEHFLNILKVVILVLIVMMLCSCTSSPNYEPNVYNNKEEIIELFKGNRQDFESLVDCLEENDTIFQAIYNETDHRCIFSPYQKSLTENADDKLISESEDFFTKYKPYSIINKDGYYSFSFLTDNEGIGLYKIISEDYDDVKNHISSYGVCEAIDDNWLYVIYEK